MDNRIGLNKGIHLAPSIGDDGELTECVNLTPDDGGLRNIPKPETIIEAGGHDLLAVHVIPETGEKHFIVGSRHAAEEDTRGRRWESIDYAGESSEGEGGDAPVEPEYVVTIWEGENAPTSTEINALADNEFLVWIENEGDFEPTITHTSRVRVARKTASRDYTFHFSLTVRQVDWQNGLPPLNISYSPYIALGASQTSISSSGYLYFDKVVYADILRVEEAPWRVNIVQTTPTAEFLAALGRKEIVVWMEERSGDKYACAAKADNDYTNGYMAEFTAVCSESFDPDVHFPVHFDSTSGGTPLVTDYVEHLIADPDVVDIVEIDGLTVSQNLGGLFRGAPEFRSGEIQEEEQQQTSQDNEQLPYRLSYYKLSGTSWEHDVHYFCSFEDKPKEVKTIGNTLVILSDNGVEYALWKRDGYVSLGGKPEETKIAFSLSGRNVVLDASPASADAASQALYFAEWIPDGSNETGHWSDVIRADEETLSSSKVVVFRTVPFREVEAYRDGYWEFARPEGTNLLPEGWVDTPYDNTDWSWIYCVGTIVNNSTVTWGKPGILFSMGQRKNTNRPFGALYIGSSTGEPEISPQYQSDPHMPPGWSDFKNLPGASSPIEIKLSSSHQTYYHDNINTLRSQNVGSVAFQEDDVESVTNAVMGRVAQWMQTATRKNKFCYPFFVRYAYRMADGSHMMHSVPVLMIPNSIGQPLVNVSSYDNNVTLKVYVGGPQVSLEVNKLSVPKSIEDWSDIITGIDIFVTQQFYGYNPTGKIKTQSIASEDKLSSYTVSSHLQIGKGYSKARWITKSAFNGSGIGAGTNSVSWSLDLPSPDMWDEDSTTLSEAEKQSFDSQIEQENKFYLLKSFALWESPDSGRDNDVIHAGEIAIDSGRLETISVQETLKDDYFSHDKRIASMAFAYNNRLNLAGIKREAFKGFAPNYIACYRELVEREVTTDVDGEDWMLTAIFTHIKGDKGDIVVKAGGETWGRYGEEVAKTYLSEWFFYPNPKAYKITVCLSKRSGDIYEEREILLKEHSGLNGAYWFAGLMGHKQYGVRSYYLQMAGDEVEIEKGTPVTATIDNITTLPHSLYQSRVDNPFQFEADGVSEVGTGSIVAITAATKALSPGQRGRSPLYAFSTDGIWDLTMTDDGRWATVHPVSNDVCNNARSIVAVEGAVLFGTDQGLKLLQGEETVLLSEVMDGHSSRMVLNNGDDAASYMYDAMNVQTSPYHELADKIEQFKMHNSQLETSDLTDSTENVLVLKDVLRDCIGTYDYASRLVHLYASGAKHYVYSLQSREFSTALDRVVKTMVQGYPEAYVQYENGDIAVYGVQDKEDATLRPGFLVTRPIGFGDAMGMKILRDMRLMYRKTVADTEQNGTPRLGTRCVVAKFVSNDRLRWLPLTSLHRHSYKWYRFAIFTWMADGDVLEGMVCRTETVRNNRLR